MTPTLTAERICLGTAQLGLEYGIANRAGRPTGPQAFCLLETAHRLGIRMLDTACSYGNSEQLIGEFMGSGRAGFDVVTKLSCPGPCDPEIMEKLLEKSLSRLATPAVHAVLIHDFTLYQKNPWLWDWAQGLKNRRVTRHVGFSVYYPREVAFLLDRDVHPDLVQVPYNVLDTRFAPLFSELRRRSISVHARSPFLQGAVFLPGDRLTGVLENIRESVQRMRELADRRGVSLRDVCLSFVAQEEAVDRIVLGVDTADQLEANVGALGAARGDAELMDGLRALAVNRDSVVVPAEWGKRS